MWGNLMNDLSNVANEAVNDASTVYDGATHLAEEGASTVYNDATTVTNELANDASTVYDGATHIAEEGESTVNDAATHIADGLSDGAEDLTNTVIGAGENVANGANTFAAGVQAGNLGEIAGGLTTLAEGAGEIALVAPK